MKKINMVGAFGAHPFSASYDELNEGHILTLGFCQAWLMAALILAGVMGS